MRGCKRSSLAYCLAVERGKKFLIENGILFVLFVFVISIVLVSVFEFVITVVPLFVYVPSVNLTHDFPCRKERRKSGCSRTDGYLFLFRLKANLLIKSRL